MHSQSVVVENDPSDKPPRPAPSILDGEQHRNSVDDGFNNKGHRKLKSRADGNQGESLEELELLQKESKLREQSGHRRARSSLGG